MGGPLDGWTPGRKVAATDAADELRTTLDTIPALAWRADADGSAEWFNRRWLDYTGLRADEAHGTGWTRALHPDDVDGVVEQWRTIVASRAAGALSARLRRDDGRYRWFLFRAVPARDATGTVTHWYGTNTDIEDYKCAEQALRASEQRFRLIVDYLPGLVATMSPEGEVEHVNQRILDFGGATLEELRDWRPWVHPDDLPRVGAAWGHAVATGEPYDIEHRVRGAGGVYRWFHVRALPLRDPAGRILRWYVLFADVEDRKRVEATLWESERALRLLFESIPGMIAVNGADGQLEYVNQRLLDFVGRTLAELQDLGWARILHPDDADPTVAEWLRCFRTGEPLDVTFRIRRADGVYRWFQARSEPRIDEHGTIAGWYALLWDIEEQKQIESALRRSEAELARISRIVTMGELTASIAHEINQPLSAVANNADAGLVLIERPHPPLGEIRDALADIVDDAHRASAIIARVRQLASRAPLDRTVLDLRDVVADVLTLARHESDSRRVTIRVELPAALPRVLGDRVQLQQVLLNLVVNAMDASSAVEEARRTVTIGGHRARRDGTLEAVVSVQDAGLGVPPDQRTRLFDAFYTTKPEGMGLGLAISRSIVVAHGGRLWVESNQGPGATFRFSLPAAAEAARSA